MVELREGPTRKHLREDLMKDAHDRLIRWLKDTLGRCEMAQLSQSDAHQMILTCLTNVMLEGYILTGVKLPDFLTLMQHFYTAAKEKLDG